MGTLCSYSGSLLLLLLCIWFGMTNGQIANFRTFDGNNHTYAFLSFELVGNTGLLTFDSAVAFASTLRYAGNQQGYLATITNSQEQEFLSEFSNEFFRGGIGGAWMGGRRDSNFQWHWINGPENGVSFSNNVTCVSYCNWATDHQGNQLEPNNYQDRESALEWYNNGTIFAPVYNGVPGQWNDYDPSQAVGAIIEFGGLSTLTPSIIFDPLLNASATNVSFSQGVEFPQSDLTHQIYPRDLPSAYTRFAFASLIEYDHNSGAPVAEFDLTSAHYVANAKTPAGNSVGFSFQVAPLPVYSNRNAAIGSYLLVTFQLEEQGGAAPVTIGVNSFPCTLKWSLGVVGWPFKDPRNTLQLAVDLVANPANPITSVSTPTTTTTAATFTITTRATTVGVSVPLEATIDGTPTALPLLFSLGNNNRLLFAFPAFNRSLSYDPTVGVLYGGSSDDTQNNDDALIIGLTVGLVGGALLVVLVVVLVGLFAGGCIMYYGKALLHRDFVKKHGDIGEVL